MDERNRDKIEKELNRRGIDPARETKFVDHVLTLFGGDFGDDPDDRDVEDFGVLAEAHYATYRFGQENTERGRELGPLLSVDTPATVPRGDVGRRRMVKGTRSATDTPSTTSVGIRIAAFSEYLARIIATDQGVIRFREKCLGGPTNTLTFEQAQNLVDSPAARFLSYDFFQRQGIAFAEHEAVLENYEEVREDGTRYHRATVSIDPPGIKETVRSGNVREGAIQSLWWSQDDDSEFAQHVRVWEDSVLGELHRLASRLARKHPWQEDQAALFVLTGTTPLASTLRGGTRFSDGTGVAAHKYDYTIITLEARDWVPAEEVVKAYRELQREVYGGHNYRSPEDRNVEVFRFVLGQSEVQMVSRAEYLAKLTLPKWKEMRRLWNELYPRGHGWHYYGSRDPDARIFRRDFDRGQQAVIGTKWGLPGVPDQPRTRAEALEHAQRIVRERPKW